MVPRNWYIQEETKRKTIDWDCMSHEFGRAFSFTSEDQILKDTLVKIKEFIFQPKHHYPMHKPPMCVYHKEM